MKIFQVKSKYFMKMKILYFLKYPVCGIGNKKSIEKDSLWNELNECVEILVGMRPW